MFQAFTGNSRKPRQVNLSRRNNDPFASTRSSGAGKPPGGSGNALEDAQQARKARQAERERHNASRTIQKTWRGHSERRALRQRWRPMLNESESRLKAKQPAERGLEEVRSHLRLCVHTVSPPYGDAWAAEKLLYAGQWVYENAADIARAMQREGSKSPWAALLRSFSRLLAGSLDTLLFLKQPKWAKQLQHANTTGDASVAAVQQVFANIETEAPGTADRSKRMFLLLASIIVLLDSSQHIDWRRHKSASLAALAPGPDSSSDLLVSYYRFVSRLSSLQWLPTHSHEQQLLWNSLLSDTTMQSSAPLVSVIAAPGFSLSKGRSETQQKVVYSSLIVGLLTTPELAKDILLALRSVLVSKPFYEQARKIVIVYNDHDGTSITKCQHLLANVICMTTIKDALDRPDVDVSMRSYTAHFLSFVSSVLSLFTTIKDFDAFTLTQLRELTSVDTIADLFRRGSLLDDAGTDNQAEADVLSDYILNIIRILPHQQAEDIRMRLYISHEYQNQRNGGNVPQKTAIRYFWEAASETVLFKRAIKGWPEVRDLLSEASDARKREWKVIVLFIEIYDIALRIQDDEQFVHGLKSPPEATSSSTLSSMEIQMLLEFLKNACYCLYLRMDIESDTPQIPTRSIGINTQHLKGSVTGLLRLIYERDSRRRFLPEGSFLMLIDDKEAQNFVNSVIRETILKQKLDDELSDDELEQDEEPDDFDTDRDRSHGVIVSQHMQRLERHSQLARQQRILANRRAREEAAPRVKLLENVPFLIPFETRVQLFRMHVEDDMCLRRGGDPDPDRWRLHSSSTVHQAQLNRETIFEDAFNAFDKLGEGLKEPIRISFVGEEGIDGGGVTKEFLTSVINDVFRVDSPYRLFTENDDHMLYPNPHALEEVDAELDEFVALGEHVTQKDREQRRRRVLEYYRFAGRLVGKCLYEGILVDIPLARFFVAKWAATGGPGAAPNETTYRPRLNDMWDYDKAIFRSLLNLHNSKDDVSTWGITFAVDEDVAGKQVEHELMPGGADTLVNNINRFEYILRLVNHYLMKRQGRQTRAFLDGLSSIIKPTWLRMFNEAEIRVLLGGESRPIDVEDLRRNTICSGIYAIGDDGLEHDTVRMFWEVMHEMEDSDRRKLLQYVTSTPNAPLMGFAHLNPRFSIRDSSHDQGRLPTSSTCANLLKLPMYRSKAVLRDRVMTAIHSGAGFDLS